MCNAVGLQCRSISIDTASMRQRSRHLAAPANNNNTRGRPAGAEIDQPDNSEFTINYSKIFFFNDQQCL